MSDAIFIDCKDTTGGNTSNNFNTCSMSLSLTEWTEFKSHVQNPPDVFISFIWIEQIQVYNCWRSNHEKKRPYVTHTTVWTMSEKFIWRRPTVTADVHVAPCDVAAARCGNVAAATVVPADQPERERRVETSSFQSVIVWFYLWRRWLSSRVRSADLDRWHIQQHIERVYCHWEEGFCLYSSTPFVPRYMGE